MADCNKINKELRNSNVKNKGGLVMSNTTQALSRIEAILDDSSFVEIGAGVTARSTDFKIQ